jgi:hypothetical protein
MLTRLQRDRERARPWSSKGGGGRGVHGGMLGFTSQNSSGACLVSFCAVIVVLSYFAIC